MSHIIHESDPSHPALWACVVPRGALRVISVDNQWILQSRSGAKQIKWRSIAFCGAKVGLIRALRAEGVLNADLAVKRFPEHHRHG